MPSIAHRGRGRRTINEINMVPFIDVMLVLLIILTVTAPLIAPSIIDLPNVGEAARQPDQVIQVVVDKGDALELRVNEQTSAVTLPELAAAVRRAQGARGSVAAANSAVVISADRSVQYERVVRVMDVLQRAGVERVGLSVQLKP